MKPIEGMTRQEMIEALLEQELAVCMDDASQVQHMILNGCRGLHQLTDEELAEELRKLRG